MRLRYQTAAVVVVVMAAWRSPGASGCRVSTFGSSRSSPQQLEERHRSLRAWIGFLPAEKNADAIRMIRVAAICPGLWLEYRNGIKDCHAEWRSTFRSTTMFNKIEFSRVFLILLERT